jgi:hypothetical protein
VIVIYPISALYNGLIFSGMFLFAKLVVLNLYNQTSRKKLMEEMEERFPRNLEEA